MAAWKRSAREFVVNNLGRSLHSLEQAVGDVRSWFVDNLAKDVERAQELLPPERSYHQACDGPHVVVEEVHELVGHVAASNVREACSNVRRAMISSDNLNAVRYIREVRDQFVKVAGVTEQHDGELPDDYRLFSTYYVAHLLYDAASDMPEELRDEVLALSNKLRGAE